MADLVARGRFPHQSLLRQWSAEDRQAVVDAMEATGVAELSGREVDELSGGQRQRVWVSMLLAQQMELMLLDEPTTFLDIRHQYELLELFRGLHRQGRTVVAVLHDLNQAARFATHLIVMKDGQVVATGAPADVLTAELVESTYGLPCVIVPDPVTGTPAVFPRDGVFRAEATAAAATIGIAGESHEPSEHEQEGESDGTLSEDDAPQTVNRPRSDTA